MKYEIDIDKYLPYDTSKPVIPHLRTNTVGKAFILNAIATALIAFVAVETRFLLEKNENITNEALCITITLCSSLCSSLFAALVIYSILFVLFNFGGGMMATGEPIKAKI